MRYPNASTEPLEIIRVNECDASPGLRASRFQALWNEIERLRAVLETAKHVSDLDHRDMLDDLDAGKGLR